MKRFLAILLVLMLMIPAMALSAMADAPVTLTFLHHLGEQGKKDGLQALADMYTAQHPNVTFDIQFVSMDDIISSIKQANAAQSVPEILNIRQAQVASDLMETGIFEPLAADYYPEAMSKSAIEALAFGGVNYGIPLDVGAIGLYYNETILKNNGIDPKELETLSGFMAACKKLKDAGITPMASGYAENWPEWVIAEGMFYAGLMPENPTICTDLMAGTKKFADFKDALIPMIEARFSLLNDYALVDDRAKSQQASEQYAQFGRGDAAMMYQGSWAISDIRIAQTAAGNTDTFRFSFPPLYDDPAKNKVCTLVDDSFNIGAMSENKEIALEFGKLCMTPEAAKVWSEKSNCISPVEGVVIENEDPLTTDIKAVLSGEHAFFFEANPIFSGQFYTEYDNLFVEARASGKTGAELIEMWDAAFDNARATMG